MKLLLALLLLSSPLFPQEEVMLRELIEISKKNLVEEETLLKLFLDFQKKRGAFVEDPDSPKLATALVKSAKKMRAELEKSHVKHLFSPPLEEIHFFSEAGK